MESETNHLPEAGDLVWGIGNIGRVIGRSLPQTYHLIKNEHLPVKQVGKRWVASKAKLIAALTEDVA